VTDHVEQPDETPGPTAALVVVDHVDRILAMPQLTEQRFQIGFGRQQAGAGGWPSWVRFGSTKRAPGICPSA
jgi:hypothetical protein